MNRPLAPGDCFHFDLERISQNDIENSQYNPSHTHTTSPKCTLDYYPYNYSSEDEDEQEFQFEKLKFPHTSSQESHLSYAMMFIEKSHLTDQNQTLF